MRERAALRRTVRALSAEGKMSGWILMLLPVGVFFIVYLMNPTYFAPMFHTAVGWLLTGTAVLLMVVGGVWMNAMIKIKY